MGYQVHFHFLSYYLLLNWSRLGYSIDVVRIIQYILHHSLDYLEYLERLILLHGLFWKEIRTFTSETRHGLKATRTRTRERIKIEGGRIKNSRLNIMN